jgi:rubrerythrin
MNDFGSSKTKLNLARAFAGESQDGARYQFLAKQALNEGYYYMQMIFKTHAKNEMAHAKRFFDLLNEYSDEKLKNIDLTGGYPFTTGTLLESIEDTMNTEKSQSDVIYTDFAKVAEEEGYPEIAKAFEYAGSVENCHMLMLKQLHQKLKNNELYCSKEPNKWKCSNCGFEHTAKECWETCPSCLMDQGYAEIPIDMNSGD